MRMNILQHACVFLIRAYQIILSPLLGGQCRFSPTCSEYGIGCIEKHGCIKGLVLITKRLLKCHPFHPGGYDPVPECKSCTNKEIS